MSLLIILLIGANIGWLASIVLFVDRARDVLTNVGLGVAGAFVCGVLASSVSLLEGITPMTLVAAAVGALGLVAIVNIAARRDRLHDAAPRAIMKGDLGRAAR